ncbi:GNAT family N-acetyltransferase [Streptomyces sp. A7024]|uniref:GNAT family N-acetyltransferase n=1 Tax=Streptomyces coryli TaxID=1128680 RepID=A0A6G4U4B4_9ACTN|nr:GNAT family N-acetyltransferase [Streptomyces coryli]NGN66556.1 GNAT family N-acetyltransferase [Streptomyces coryli]
MTPTFTWRGDLTSAEVEALHAEGFDHAPLRGADWEGRLRRHSLGWVCARSADGSLTGFVNVAWDGGAHAFILDTVVAKAAHRRGVGVELIRTAAREARAAGCEWLHVDFEDKLHDFYITGCGFTPTPAGLIAL